MWVLVANTDEKKDTLPSNTRTMIKEFISETTEEAINLVVNISGVYLDKKKRKQFREKVKQETAPEFEKYISKNILLGKEMVEEIQLKEVTGAYVKEKIYLILDNMRVLIDDIPEDVHVLDYMVSALKEVKDVRFELSYLENTKYLDYIMLLEDLLKQIDEEDKIGLAGQFIWNFLYTNDAYALLQSAFYKMSDQYLFLEKERQVSKKEQVNKYLEIYGELAGHFEKFVYLLVGLVKILNDKQVQEYLSVKKDRLFTNLEFLRQFGNKNLVSGFNRHLRNSVVHKNFKIDLINEVVIFYDISYKIEKSFNELQKSTRELSANLLVMPNLFIMTFYLALSQFKTLLDKL